MPLIDFECGKADGDILIELSRRMPHVEHLGTVQYWWNGKKEINNNRNSNQTDSFHSANNYKLNWKYFNAFTNLKSINLKSDTVDFSDSGEFFHILSKRNTVDELQLIFGLDKTPKGNAVKVADLQRLTKLKTLHLHNFNEKVSNDFVKKFLVNLPALTTCTIDGKRLSQTRIIEFIGLSRHLKKLTLECVVTKFSKVFYKKLIKSRQSTGAGSENPLAIHIDSDDAQHYVELLGEQYKPSIILLRSI